MFVCVCVCMCVCVYVCMCVCRVACVSIGLLVDRWGYGFWTFTPWNFFRINVLHGVSHLYGIVCLPNSMSVWNSCSCVYDCGGILCMHASSVYMYLYLSGVLLVVHTLQARTLGIGTSQKVMWQWLAHSFLYYLEAFMSYTDMRISKLSHHFWLLYGLILCIVSMRIRNSG